MRRQRDIARAFVGSRERFTIGDIVATGIGRSTAQNVVHELVREGVVRVAGKEPGATRGRVAVYERTGSVATARPARDGRQRAWTAMRIKRAFTIGDLVSLASITRTNATSYVHLLIREGIVRESGRMQPSGHPGSFKVYRLLKDTGPHAPVLTKPTEEVPHG